MKQFSSHYFWLANANLFKRWKRKLQYIQKNCYVNPMNFLQCVNIRCILHYYLFSMKKEHSQCKNILK